MLIPTGRFGRIVSFRRIGDSDLVNLCGMVISALSALGVLVDPTTAGVSDSNRAMGYDAPGDSEAAYLDEHKEEF